MAKNTTTTLPPRHGGYRPVRAKTPIQQWKAKILSVPRPPAGKGGGSKVVAK